MRDGSASTETSGVAGPGWLASVPPSRRMVLVAAACVAVVYLAGAYPIWRPTPDSALYLAVGRSIAEGRGVEWNGGAFTTTTAGLPAILAGVRLVFGDGFRAPNLLMALSTLGALGVVYVVLRRLSDRRTALAAVLLTACSYTFYFNTHKILTGAPFTLLLWVIVYALLRGRAGRWWWLAAVAGLVAAATAIRVPGVILLGPLAVGVAWDRPGEKRLGRRLTAAAAVLAPAVVVGAAFYLWAQAAGSQDQAYVAGAMRGVSHGLWATTKQLLEAMGHLPLVLAEMLTGQDGRAFLPLGAAVLGLIVLGSAGLWRKGQRFLVVAAAGYIVALGMLGPTSIRVRYMVPIQPLLAYLTVQGLCGTAAWLQRRRGRAPSPRTLLTACTVLVAVAIVPNAPKILRDAGWYSYLANTDEVRYRRIVRDGQHAELAPVTEAVLRHCPPDAAVGVPADKQSIFHYLTARRTLSPYLGPTQTPADAETFHKALTSLQDTNVFILHLTGVGDNFRTRLVQLFDTDPKMTPAHNGTRYRVYVRLAAKPTSK